MPELGAVIFDFDGTIADSEPFHLAAFQRTFSQELGLELTEAQYKERYLAFDDRRMIQNFLADRGAEPERLEHLLEIKEAHYAALAGAPVILPGAPALIRACAKRWPLAIASGALQNEIRPLLEGAGLLECFSPIISAEMVERGKPDPESFLAALEGINEGRAEKIDRAACLVLEDSAAGVASGRAAGMRVLAVTNSLPREQLGEADRVVDSLEEAADAGALAVWFAALPPR
jgi:beta-phosphoglucomutase-like phosphatase (HAD superfamily)